MAITHITILKDFVAEEGTCFMVTVYRDETGAAVTPDSATWTLTNDRGVVINSNLSVPITPISTTNTIKLEGDDLEIGDNGVTRHFLVEYIYDSDLGDDNIGKAQINFQLQNFSGIT